MCSVTPAILAEAVPQKRIQGMVSRLSGFLKDWRPSLYPPTERNDRFTVSL